jgi:hypothetical protein
MLGTEQEVGSSVTYVILNVKLLKDVTTQCLRLLMWTLSIVVVYTGRILSTKNGKPKIRRTGRGWPVDTALDTRWDN